MGDESTDAVVDARATGAGRSFVEDATSKTHIGIVNYNSARLVRDCVESLASEGVDVVWILDNASPASSELAALRQLARETALDVRVVEQSTNSGFGAGVNFLLDNMSLTDDDRVLVLNPDTVVERGAVSALSAHLANGGADFVSPVVLSGEPSESGTVWFAGGEVDLRRGAVKHWHWARPRSVLPANPYPTSFLCGVAFMCTGRTWRAIGGFASHYFMYWEDAELSTRIRSASLVAAVIPQAVIWHHEGGSSTAAGAGGKSATFYYYMQRNRLILAREYGLAIDVAVGRGVIATGRLLAKPLLAERNERLQKTVASICGLFAGVLGRTGNRYQHVGAVRRNSTR